MNWPVKPEQIDKLEMALDSLLLIISNGWT
jgi:hypothetical protein